MDGVPPPLSQDVTLGGPGTYDVTEASQEGWQLANVSCTYGGGSVGQSIAGGETITVDYGDHVTCTFTDTQRSVLYVNKAVVNDNSGTAKPSDFSFRVNGLESTFTFNENGKNYLLLDPGTYTVTETPADGYTASYQNCTSLELAAGGSATCVVTNDDIAPAAPSTGGGGGNGPIAGLLGGGGGGLVLGASTTTAPGAGTTGQTSGASAPACQALITVIPLALGLPNDPSQVRALQTFLNGEVNAGLPTTGFFGALTQTAVQAFQLKYWQEVLAPWVPFGLPTDHTATGWVGKSTAWKINMLSCPSLNLPFPTLP